MDYKRYTDGNLNTIILLSDDDKLNAAEPEVAFKIINVMGKNGLFHMVYAVVEGNVTNYFYLMNGDGASTSENLTNIVSYITAMKRNGAVAVDLMDVQCNSLCDNNFVYLIRFKTEK